MSCGALFWYHENAALNARSYFAPSIGQNIPNNFGVSMGGPNPTTVRNPSTGQPFPNNLIPADLLNAGSVRWQDRFYLLPNFGPPSSTVSNYRETVPQQLKHDQFDVRLDYAVTSSNNLYGRVSYKNSIPRVLDGGLPPGPIGYRIQKREARQVAISDTWTLTPTLIMSSRLDLRAISTPGAAS